MMAVSYAAVSAIVSHLISNRKASLVVYRLHVHRPMDIAEELTLVDAEMFRKIHSDELRDGAWMDKAKVRAFACMIFVESDKPHVIMITVAIHIFMNRSIVL